MHPFIKHAGKDLPAAIVVFLIAIPLCLGIAVASGLPPFTGIIAGIAGGVVVGLLSKSNLSVSGPAAGLTVTVATAVMELPAVEAFFLAVCIAGILQVVMGICKLGVIGDYVPNAVIKGMLAAIGVILILKQIPYLVGFKTSYEGDDSFIESAGGNTFSSVLNSLNHLTPIAVVIGLTGIAILILFDRPWFKTKKIFNLLSGPLVVVIAGTLMNKFLTDIPHPLTNPEAQLVSIPIANSAKEFIGFFHLPDLQYLTLPKVWMVAFTIALVASLETLLSIEAIDKLDELKRPTPTNRELIAQGAGNFVSGMLGGLPVTSVIVRSSANVNAGAQTKTSAILHGLLILGFVMLLPSLLNQIPLAALAAILIMTGYKLAKLTLFKAYWKMGWESFMPFVVTLVAIVFTDLLKGVFIGIAVAIFYIIRSNFRTAIFKITDNNNVLIRFKKDVSFFSKPTLKKLLEEVPANSNLILDMSKAEFIDKDVLDTVDEYLTYAKQKNIFVTVNASLHNNTARFVKPVPMQDDAAH